MDTSKSLIRKEMGSRVRALRRARGLSIDELSAQLELTPSHLGLIERGERGVTVERLIHVCTFFGCNADFMLTGKKADDNPDDSMPATSIDLILNGKEKDILAEFIHLLRG